MNTHNLVNQDIDLITATVQDYFDGLHHADVNKLRQIFHADACLQAPGLRRSLSEWLKLVAQREVPAAQGVQFLYRIVSIDLIGDQAMVKLVCPLLGRTYIDFLGLLKEDASWKIVNKMYADL